VAWLKNFRRKIFCRDCVCLHIFFILLFSTKKTMQTDNKCQTKLPKAWINYIFGMFEVKYIWIFRFVSFISLFCFLLGLFIIYFAYPHYFFLYLFIVIIKKLRVETFFLVFLIFYFECNQDYCLSHYTLVISYKISPATSYAVLVLKKYIIKYWKITKRKEWKKSYVLFHVKISLTFYLAIFLFIYLIYQYFEVHSSILFQSDFIIYNRKTIILSE
jgi:hypothetical protein